MRVTSMKNNRLNVAVLGGSGYTGGELLRLLTQHPRVQITMVTADKSVGLPVNQVFPHLESFCGLTFESIDLERITRQSDLGDRMPHGSSLPGHPASGNSGFDTKLPAGISYLKGGVDLHLVGTQCEIMGQLSPIDSNFSGSRFHPSPSNRIFSFPGGILTLRSCHSSTFLCEKNWFIAKLALGQAMMALC